ADQAHSNYSQTTLSLSGTLNMNWVQTLLADHDTSSQWRRPLSLLIGNNLAVEMLRRAGYRIIDHPSEYSVLHLDAPTVARRPWIYFTEFEYTFLAGTPLAAVTKLFGLPEDLLQAVHRNQVRWVMTDLRQGVGADEPAFVFAHLLVPHPPFVFQP